MFQKFAFSTLTFFGLFCFIGQADAQCREAYPHSLPVYEGNEYSGGYFVEWRYESVVLAPLCEYKRSIIAVGPFDPRAYKPRLVPNLYRYLKVTDQATGEVVANSRENVSWLELATVDYLYNCIEVASENRQEAYLKPIEEKQFTYDYWYSFSYERILEDKERIESKWNVTIP